MEPLDLIQGTAPLLVSMPHCGTAIPAAIAEGMTELSLTTVDTDWHVEKLYEFAGELGASIIRPHTSRYVIDLNRPPDNAELYPGAAGTDLCPVSSFSGNPIYQAGKEPDDTEIAHRIETYWRPYHSKLQSELARLKQQHGVAVLFDAHSICSQVPLLFDGRLPDFNIGTAAGSSCDPGLLSVAERVLSNREDYSCVSNHRFKGGYITRAYGNPSESIHAIQLELAQRTYMNENPPFSYLPERAQKIQPLLRQLLQAIIVWAQERPSE
ncbi:MAG: N-formylglutamate deformylase [Proteobacteria bacterium]|nr:N-formylglutamate deformylase [Pseudomonadota bacterium]